MNWIWVMIVFLFNSCFAVPTSEENNDVMQKSEEFCYLRTQLHQCNDQTHLDVDIDGIVRHSVTLNNEEFLCLPVYCDESRSNIVGKVTVATATGLTEPKEGFSGDVVGLFSVESECQKEGSDFVVITCPKQEQGNEDAALNEVIDELMVSSHQDSSINQVNSMKCYLRLNARCNHDVRLSLTVGDTFQTKVYVEGSNGMDESIECIEVPCSDSRRLPGDTIITGNRITVEPTDFYISRISTFSDKEECMTGNSNEDSSVTVTCESETEFETQDIEEMSFELEDFSQMSVTKDETADIQWNNNWDGPLKVNCGNTNGIRRVRSQHDNGREDRLWQFDCHKIAKVGFDKCYWTGFVNGWDQPFYYQCSANYVLTGVESYHDNGSEDRRWKFLCCHAPNHFTRNCFVTGYINNWDGWMDYGVSYPQVFTGAFSYHDNGKEDRRWQIEVCQYQYCAGV